MVYRIYTNFSLKRPQIRRTIDFEAQDDGIIAKILKEGKDAVDLKVGVPICVVVDDEDDVSSFANYTVEEDKPEASSADSAPNAASVSDESIESTANVSLEHILMPAARHLSQSRGLDATGLKGSGKGGRVTKADVLKDTPRWHLSTTTFYYFYCSFSRKRQCISEQ
jgi:Pyruvate/2-oxoglutarate dehydrogenase complex, dihydrolipoamide acyltransferase (E2) component, and related enzymes